MLELPQVLAEAGRWGSGMGELGEGAERYQGGQSRLTATPETTTMASATVTNFASHFTGVAAET